MIPPESPFSLRLRCSSLPEGALEVMEARGREELGQLWSFELLAHPTAEELTLEDLGPLLAGGAELSFGPGREHPIHGVIRELDLAPSELMDEVPIYRLRFLPRAWDAGMHVGSYLHRAKRVDRILADTLARVGLAEGRDFELRLKDTYPLRAHVAQHEESALDFACRVAEHWGIFFFWAHGPEGSRVVFADHNEAFAPLPGEAVLFDPEPAEGPAKARARARERIHHLSVERRSVPRRFELRERDPRAPRASCEASPSGIGSVSLYGEHALDAAEGARLARIRAEEAASLALRMKARGNLRAARAGARLELRGHPMKSLDRAYAVAAVEHTYRQEGRQVGEGGYSCHLSLLPLEVPFRPPRRTLRPTVLGPVRATLAAEPPIEEGGRYRVALPYPGDEGEVATCWIPAAASFKGEGPLAPGAEVILDHLEGDPDRPFLVGALEGATWE